MGLFSFISDAGKKLFGKDEPAEKKAEAVQKELKTLGLEGDIKVNVENDKIHISGSTQDTTLKEKIILAAGNVEGISTVDADIKVDKEATKESQFHTVVAGDTLWKISAKYYADGNDYPKIFEANKPMLSAPDKIYVGQTLRIPEKAT